MTENINTPEVPNEPQELTTPTGERVPLSDAQRALVGKHWTQRLGTANAPKPEAGDDEPVGSTKDEPKDKPEDQQPAAEGHELAVPEEVPQQFLEETTANVQQAALIAQEMNVPREEAQTLVDYAVGLAVTDQSQVDISDPDACMGVLMSRYGRDEGTKIVSDARAAVDRLGPKAVAFLDSTGLGNSPAVLAALAAFHRGDLRMSTEKAQAELDKLKGEDLRSAYKNANHSGHKAAVDRASLLYRIIAKAEAKKSSEPAKAKPAAKPSGAKQSQEAELKSLIAHPAYRDKSHREYGSVKARIEALYASIYPGNADDES